MKKNILLIFCLTFTNCAWWARQRARVYREKNSHPKKFEMNVYLQGTQNRGCSFTFCYIESWVKLRLKNKTNKIKRVEVGCIWSWKNPRPKVKVLYMKPKSKKIVLFRKIIRVFPGPQTLQPECQYKVCEYLDSTSNCVRRRK